MPFLEKLFMAANLLQISCFFPARSASTACTLHKCPVKQIQSNGPPNVISEFFDCCIFLASLALFVPKLEVV